MTDTSKHGTDDATFGFFLFLVAVGTLAATAISVIVAAAVLLTAWFFGQPRRTAFIVLGAAALAVIAQPLIPGLTAFVYTAFIVYRDASQHEHYFIAAAIEWLRFAINPQAWLRLMPLGLAVGAACLFAIETRRASFIRKVFGGEGAAGPSPWARIMVRRVLKGPLVYRGKIVLGAEAFTGKRTTVSRAQLNQHVFVGGRSGRGKTETVFTLCAGSAQLGIPVIYIDGKGDPAVQEALRQIAAALNRPFYAFDAANPLTSCAWDVLADMNPTTQADTMVALRPFSEAHFEAKVGKFAVVTCDVLKHVGIEVDLFTFKKAFSVNQLLALLRRKATKEDHVGRALMKEVLALREIEAEATDSLMSELGRLTDSVFGFLFDIERAKREGRPILRLLQARRELAIVYIGLPALEYPKMTPKVGGLGISALKAILPALDREHQAQSKKPLPLAAKQLLCVFDEWGVFAGDHVLNVVNMGRSFGGSCCLATQTFADFLVDGHDQLLRQVAGSTATFVMHELNDPQDAEYAAGLFGTQDSVEYTAQTVLGTPTGAASARGVKEFAVHPDDVKNVGVGEAYYMNKNDKDKKTKKSIVRLVKIRKSTN